jgi:hypothetical protein
MSRAPRPVVRVDPAERRRREWARQSIRFLTAQYRKSGNPVWAWDAIAWCVSYEFPLPAWTRAYLLDVAGKMAKLSRGNVPGKNAIDPAVARAVGLTGKGRFNPFREPTRPAHEMVVAFEVYTYFNKHQSYSWDAVFADVAASHPATCDQCRRISPATVKRYWYRQARTVIPPHLVARARSQKLDDILR